MWSVAENETLPVAVKTINSDVDEMERVKFLQEAAIMGQFLHPSVVKLYGVVTLGEPVSLDCVYSCIHACVRACVCEYVIASVSMYVCECVSVY